MIGVRNHTGVDPCNPLEQPKLILSSGDVEIVLVDNPNPQSVYDNNADCQWHIKVTSGFVVELIFLELDVEYG